MLTLLNRGRLYLGLQPPSSLDQQMKSCTHADSSQAFPPYPRDLKARLNCLRRARESSGPPLSFKQTLKWSFYFYRYECCYRQSNSRISIVTSQRCCFDPRRVLAVVCPRVLKDRVAFHLRPFALSSVRSSVTFRRLSGSRERESRPSSCVHKDRLFTPHKAAPNQAFYPS